MNIKSTLIKDLLIITPDVFTDNRGYFYESYNEKKYKRIGLNAHFVQDNQSQSSKGTIRGLHFQIGEFAQGKLVRVVAGSVIDYAVDIRWGSPTFGRYEKVLLSAANKVQFWIPPGFAHGFVALEDSTVMQYKCTAFYSKEHERGIYYDDPDIGIDWGVNDPFISEKDKTYPLMKDMEKYFYYEDE